MTELEHWQESCINHYIPLHYWKKFKGLDCHGIMRVISHNVNESFGVDIQSKNVDQLHCNARIAFVKICKDEFILSIKEISYYIGYITTSTHASYKAFPIKFKQPEFRELYLRALFLTIN